jgi:hypothetical protein
VPRETRHALQAANKTTRREKSLVFQSIRAPLAGVDKGSAQGRHRWCPNARQLATESTVESAPPQWSPCAAAGAAGAAARTTNCAAAGAAGAAGAAAILLKRNSSSAAIKLHTDSSSSLSDIPTACGDVNWEIFRCK